MRVNEFMNKIILIGRIARDIEIKYIGADNTLLAKTSIAVPRTRTQDKEVDFINLTAFGKTAELLSKYVDKGHRIGVIGELHLNCYTNQNGVKVYTHDVVVSEVEFLQPKAETSKAEYASTTAMKADITEQLPF